MVLQELCAFHTPESEYVQSSAGAPTSILAIAPSSSLNIGKTKCAVHLYLTPGQ